MRSTDCCEWLSLSTGSFAVSLLSLTSFLVMIYVCRQQTKDSRLSLDVRARAQSPKNRSFGRAKREKKKVFKQLFNERWKGKLICILLTAFEHLRGKNRNDSQNLWFSKLWLITLLFGWFSCIPFFTSSFSPILNIGNFPFRRLFFFVWYVSWTIEIQCLHDAFFYENCNENRVGRDRKIKSLCLMISLVLSTWFYVVLSQVTAKFILFDLKNSRDAFESWTHFIPFQKHLSNDDDNFCFATKYRQRFKHSACWEWYVCMCLNVHVLHTILTVPSSVFHFCKHLNGFCFISFQPRHSHLSCALTHIP